MPTLLHTSPPVSSIFPNGGNRHTSPPAHNSTAAGRRRKRYPIITAATTKTKDKTQPQEDDYHAALKALNSKDRTPRKSLGQHYMLIASINEQLAAAADVKERDLVLEIGPGTGSLTNVLVDSGATVIAIEKDPYMAELARERFASVDRVKVLQEDFTRCHVRSHMLSYLEKCSLDRSLQYAKVDAAVVAFRLKQAVDYPVVSSTKSFFSMVNSVFNGKRKMLRKSLQHICTSFEIEEALRNIDLPPTSRPEELTIEDFVRLHNMLVKE